MPRQISWSPNSHDTFSLRDYQTKVQCANDLRQRLIDVWAGVEQTVMDDSTS